VSDTLRVRLDRERTHQFDAPASFESNGPFTLQIENQGTPAHLHLSLEGELAAVATLSSEQLYIEGEETASVGVRVPEDCPTKRGALELVTAHGSVTAQVSLTVSEPETVTVDDSLSKPQPDRSPISLSMTEDILPVLGLSILAVAVLVGAVVFGGDATILLGVLAVLGAIGAASYLIWAPEQQ